MSISPINNIVSSAMQTASGAGAKLPIGTGANPLGGVGSQVGGAGKAGGEGFGDLLTGFVKDANQKQAVADQAVENFSTGNDDNIQDVVVSMAKADLSFRMVLEIRDKLIDSYHEVMRMQV